MQHSLCLSIFMAGQTLRALLLSQLRKLPDLTCRTVRYLHYAYSFLSLIWAIVSVQGLVCQQYSPKTCTNLKLFIHVPPLLPSKMSIVRWQQPGSNIILQSYLATYKKKPPSWLFIDSLWELKHYTIFHLTLMKFSNKPLPPLKLPAYLVLSVKKILNGSAVIYHDHGPH